ncbi:CHAD domain-containing protein [Paraliomyxa miuraensis]|uniref:CHAD domain-containing protein n=1 Tax=Paraliomyxa miuraensis TaxID=376150 RepID=UPI00225ABD6C|nr:CHAD domain-containing protein [Paraliomyxa miuraensis]MCX4242467.1 CHAD domain-containing protein [Paraliomyxa miuraensis]
MRARAVETARRVAMGALERLGREAERLVGRLPPVVETMALRGSTAASAPPFAPAPPPIVIERATASRRPAPEEPSAREQRVEATASEPSSRLELVPPLEPSSETPTVAVMLALHLRAHLEPRLTALRHGATWAQAQEPEQALRKLRVATRRLRAFARVFAPVIGDRQARKLDKRLRVITRAAGPRREWDAILASLRREHERASEAIARAALEHVMVWAEEQREATTRRMDDVLDGKDLPGLAQAIDAALDRVCGRMLALGHDPSAQVEAWLEPPLARAVARMPTLAPEADVEVWHDVRKRAKQVRYALELVGPALDESGKTLRKRAKAIQRMLGEHRDLAVLVRLLHAQRQQLVEAGLPTLAGGLQTTEGGLIQRLRRIATTVQLDGLEPDLRGRLHARADEFRSALPEPPRLATPKKA